MGSRRAKLSSLISVIYTSARFTETPGGRRERRSCPIPRDSSIRPPPGEITNLCQTFVKLRTYAHIHTYARCVSLDGRVFVRRAALCVIPGPGKVYLQSKKRVFFFLQSRCARAGTMHDFCETSDPRERALRRVKANSKTIYTRIHQAVSLKRANRR